VRLANPNMIQLLLDPKNVICKIPSQSPNSNPHKVLGKRPRNDEVRKKPLTNQHASWSLFKGGNFSPSLLPFHVYSF